MKRKTHAEWAIAIALETAKRSTCMRRQVGCILTNSLGHVIATGYNGVSSGMPHCNEGHPCPGNHTISGKNLDLCRAIHAEQNAMLQCGNVHTIKTAYLTHSPCITCIKMFLNTSCEEIVFDQDYPHKESKVLWEGGGS